jgi:hypothetical protein
LLDLTATGASAASNPVCLASGLVETMREGGGAAGVAAVSTVLVARTGLAGLHAAFLVISIVAVLGALAAAVGLRTRPAVETPIDRSLRRAGCTLSRRLEARSPEATMTDLAPFAELVALDHGPALATHLQRRQVSVRAPEPSSSSPIVTWRSARNSSVSNGCPQRRQVAGPSRSSTAAFATWTPRLAGRCTIERRRCTMANTPSGHERWPPAAAGTRRTGDDHEG